MSRTLCWTRTRPIVLSAMAAGQIAWLGSPAASAQGPPEILWMGNDGHGNAVQAVAHSPDGEILASGGNGGWLKLWRVSDGHLLRNLTLRGFGKLAVAFSPDGQVLASHRSSEIELWRVADGELLQTLPGHPGWGVNSLAFSPDGQILASSGGDGTIKLWRVSDGQVLRTLTGHLSVVYSVAFSPDGQTLASSSWDRTIKLWRVSDGQVLRTLTGHTGPVHSVALSPDGLTLASGQRRPHRQALAGLRRRVAADADGECKLGAVRQLLARRPDPGLGERRWNDQALARVRRRAASIRYRA